jgi:hypothetical protein
MSTKELLKAAEQLKPSQLDRFVSDVIALKAQRQAPRLTAAEAELLQKINQGLSPSARKKWQHLVRKRDARKLTPREYHELVRLVDQIEELQTNRLKWMVQLAQLRKTSVDDLLKELGIQTPGHG